MKYLNKTSSSNQLYIWELYNFNKQNLVIINMFFLDGTEELFEYGDFYDMPMKLEISTKGNMSQTNE